MGCLKIIEELKESALGKLWISYKKGARQNFKDEKAVLSSDHLGNVVTTISDQKIAVPNQSGTGLTYEAVVTSATEYYPFGMAMVDRTYMTPSYRYGFNGKELDQEGLGGGGSTYDYGFRIYNPQIARFLSVDPLSANYPWYTPYQYAGNMPIAFIDLDGLEEVIPDLEFSWNPFKGYIEPVYPELKPTEWKMEDRFKVIGTFEDAAELNTKNLRADLYKPVDQIHSYYVWAAREIDKTKSNVKFFHAARDVTGFFGVGGAYGLGHAFGLVGDEAKQLLGDINQDLLELNMPNIKSLVMDRELIMDEFDALMYDLDYVVHEQRTVQTLLDDAKPSNEAIKDINTQINAFDFTNKKFSVAKALMGVDELDFRKDKQRFAIGFADVIQQHLDAGHEFTEEQKQQIDNFIKENLGVEKGFFEVKDEMDKKQKEINAVGGGFVY